MSPGTVSTPPDLETSIMCVYAPVSKYMFHDVSIDVFINYIVLILKLLRLFCSKNFILKRALVQKLTTIQIFRNPICS